MFSTVHIGIKVRFLGLSRTSFVSENGCRGEHFAPFGQSVQEHSGPLDGPPKGRKVYASYDPKLSFSDQRAVDKTDMWP